MSKMHSRFQPATLDLNELDQVIGGDGIAESIGRFTGWYSPSAGRAFDVGSQIVLGRIPGVGYAYGVAQNSVNLATTGYDYYQGRASLGDFAFAAAGLGISLIPEGNTVRALAERVMQTEGVVKENLDELGQSMREAEISANIEREDAELGQSMREAEPQHAEPEPQYADSGMDVGGMDVGGMGFA